ncbi:T9SS type A sorting domain-containing protein [Gracilimonas sp. BCB1]|uniref:T9SS type A sorting domain-containing protein n=1 Tax=Gracilimonas sp. BCB1 TaxID=3152362 RepID=UPI0032D92E3B
MKYERWESINYPSFRIAKNFKDNDIASWIDQFLVNETTWQDHFRAVYEYSGDRRTITQHFGFYDSQSEVWTNTGSQEISYNTNGFPLSVFEDFIEETYAQTFYYSEEGRLDSLHFDEVYEGGETYFQKVELVYVTPDSIRILYHYDENGEPVIDDSNYFLQKDGHFYDVYDYGDYIDRYVYFDITFNDFLKSLFDEFSMIAEYNDEFYSDEGEWIPYSRKSLTLDGDMVIEILEEYYIDGTWFPDYRERYTYEDGNISISTYETFFEDEWTSGNRTVYNYGAATSKEEEISVADYKLSQNYPNPFNPTTQIAYEISAPGKVLLEVYNVLGERVATLVNGNHVAGAYVASFNASGFPSGIYYYKLVSGQHQQVRSMTLIK